MENLLSFNFWFKMRPAALTPFYFNIIIGLVVFLFLAAIILSIIQKRNSKGLYCRFWNSLVVFSWANLIFGLLIAFFNYELVPFLSSRFWLLLWGIGIIVWLFFILKRLKSIPERKKQLAEEAEFKKYLP